MSTMGVFMEAPGLREELLSAAVKLFVKDGIENVKTRQLTDFMGISRSHIYHYFSDWQQLCLEACSQHLEKEVATFIQTAENKDPLTKLLIFTDYYLPGHNDSSWYLYRAVNYLGIHNPAYDELSRKVAGLWLSEMQKILIEGVSLGVFHAADCARTSRQLMAILNGYSDVLITNFEQDVTKTIDGDLKHFLNEFIVKTN